MTPTEGTTAAGPLAGVRVLELSHFLAGPYAGLCLADLGADVVKLEDPDHADEARSMGPHFHAGESLYFLALNWGKRSVGVRLGTPEGRTVAHALARSADVVLDNYRPGVLAKLGLDHASLVGLNPAVVTCSLTGFGETGPLARRPGYDYTIQALTGVMSQAGEPGGPPAKAGISYVDHSGGLAAALAVCAALVERARTGRGRHVDLGLVDVQVSMLTYLAAWQLNAGYEPERTPRSSHPSLVPAQNFPTAEGWLALFVGNDDMWARLVAVMGDEALARPDLATREGRAAHRREVLDRIEARLATDSAAAWAERLSAAGVACAPVNDIAGGLATEQVRARGLVGPARHRAYGAYGRVGGPLPSLSSGTDVGAPLLGEHTVEVLGALGFGEARLRELVGAGVLAAPTAPAR